MKDGHLAIHPYSGSDIYLRNENYPFVAIPAPMGETWELEIKIVNFDPQSPGKWNKGGVVLWQGNRSQLICSLVKDEEGDQIYFEALALGAKGHFFGAIKTEGFAPMNKTDAFFRIRKKTEQRFFLEASYDQNNWFDLGEYDIPLHEPQIRLFATGDIFIQYPGEFDFEVCFDYLRKIDGKENAN